ATVVNVARILVSPSWVAIRALRPRTRVPALLAGRPGLQAAARGRFGLEARVDGVVGRLVAVPVGVVDVLEARVVERLSGAAGHAVDALARRAAAPSDRARDGEAPEQGGPARLAATLARAA